MLWQFGAPELIRDRFLTLLLVGLVLGYAAMRSRSLWLPFGRHTGWILALKLFHWSTGEHRSSIWFGESPSEGLAPATLLLATFIWVGWFLRRRGT